MARLPGLTRSDDRPSVGGANRGRVQVRNPIGDVSLQPQARPVDTYSRPQQPAQGPNGLMQLAGALAQISPTLQGFIDQKAEKSKKDAEDLAQRRLGGMSFEDARKAVDSGSMSEMDNPWFKAAFMKQYGERLAYQRMNELTTEYETNFDKDGGNFDEFVRQRAQEDLEQYGNDPHFAGTYTKVMDQYSQKANQAQAQYRTEQTKMDTIGGVYDTFMGRAQTMLQDGKSPQEIVTALRGDYEGNRTLLHLDYREQDKEMVRLAESFANEGRLDMVEAILNGERKAADGTVLGPLSANREFQADSQRILAASKRKLEEVNGEKAFDARMTFNEQAREGKLDQGSLMTHHQNNPGAFTDAQVLSLINQNTTHQQQQAELAAKHNQTLELEAQARASSDNLLHRNMETAQSGLLPYIEEAKVLDSNGEPKTVSVEDQRKAVAAELSRQTDWLIQNGTDPEVAFARQVEAFTANNLTNPKWEQVLSAGHIGATQFTNSGGELPAQLRDSVELYTKLHNANPALLDQHIKDSGDRDFFEAYRIATQYGQLGTEQALQTATAMTADPTKFQSVAVQQRFDQIEERVKGANFGGFLGFGGSVPDNQGYVSNEIGRLGKFYAQNGMGTEKALDEAKKRFLATHTVVNGNYINTAGRDMPPNFSEVAGYAIQRYAEEFGAGEGGKEADDLTIRPATNGNGWLIVDRLTQLPVENSARANLTLRSLYELDEERKIKAADAVIEAQHQNQQKPAVGKHWLSDPEAYKRYSTTFGAENAEARRKELEDYFQDINRN